jgi:hypothetical protein
VVAGRVEEYRSPKNDIGDVVEDFDDVGKLGSGFVSTDELMGVDIEDEGIKRPTDVNANLTQKQKDKVHEL